LKTYGVNVLALAILECVLSALYKKFTALHEKVANLKERLICKTAKVAAETL
jgi:hypothetical protein